MIMTQQNENFISGIWSLVHDCLFITAVNQCARGIQQLDSFPKMRISFPRQTAPARSLFHLAALIILLPIMSSCSRIAMVITGDNYSASGLNSSASLPVLKNYRTMRASSEDRPGNGDFRTIEPGGSLVLADLDGPGEITHIWVTINSDDPNHLRNLILRVYYDGNDFPSVETPIGDFFGLGHGQYYTYASAMQAIGTDKGMNAFWPMPFKHSARIEVFNEGMFPAKSFYYYVDWRRFRAMPAGLGYFHAQYRQAFPCRSGKNYLIMETGGGRGHFMGVNLSIHTQVSGWWGEGDDIFTIDGEETPSLWGTGSEDYFCGAWCYGESFYYPNFGMPLRTKKGQGPDNYWNVYRYHIENPVVFEESLKVEIEHGAWGFDNSRKGGYNNDYSSVAYWYMEKPVRLSGTMPPAEERITSYRELKNPPGVFRLHFMDAEIPPGVSCDIQDVGSFTDADNKWFFSDHLFCEKNTSDSVVLFQWVTEELCSGDMVFRMTQAPDYGRLAILLDDELLIPEFNGYHPKVRPVLVPAGNRILPAGRHVMTIRTLGKDDRSTGFLWGMDYFRIGGVPPDIEEDTVRLRNGGE